VKTNISPTYVLHIASKLIFQRLPGINKLISNVKQWYVIA